MDRPNKIKHPSIPRNLILVITLLFVGSCACKPNSVGPSGQHQHTCGPYILLGDPGVVA